MSTIIYSGKRKSDIKQLFTTLESSAAGRFAHLLPAICLNLQKEVCDNSTKHMNVSL